GVAFGVNPGTVERVVAVQNLEEAGGLDIAGGADAGHLEELRAALEGAVLLAVIDQLAGHQLVQPGDVPQQRDTGGVQVDANVVDGRLDDGVKRFLEVARTNVMLGESDTNVLRVDLNQLAEGVLEAAADGDGATQGGVVIGKLLAADRAGGVDASAGLVYDDVGQLGQGRGEGGEHFRWVGYRRGDGGDA